MEPTLEDRIRERAYFLSQSGGGAGDGAHFWLIAEREVLAAMESALASPLAEAIQSVETENQPDVLQATETAQQREAESKNTAHKAQIAAKGSTKSAMAASPAAAVESPAAKPAITPTKSATKTRARAAR
jgi:hypothetical protein